MLFKNRNKKYKVHTSELLETVKGEKIVSQFQKYDSRVTLKDYWITFFLTALISFAYANFIYKNIYFALTISLVTTIFYTNYVMLLQKKKAYNEQNRKQINLYMTLMSQMVSAKQNLLNAFIIIAPNLQGKIKEDVYEMIRQFEMEGYPYDALDNFSNKYYKDTYLKMFHDQLKLTFRHGGNEEIVCDIVNEHSALEVFMDEYSKQKKFYRQYTYIFLGFLAVFPVFFVVLQGSWYSDYANSLFGLIANSIIYIIALLISTAIEKKYLDDKLIEF